MIESKRRNRMTTKSVICYLSSYICSLTSDLRHLSSVIRLLISDILTIGRCENA